MNLLFLHLNKNVLFDEFSKSVCSFPVFPLANYSHMKSRKCYVWPNILFIERTKPSAWFPTTLKKNTFSNRKLKSQKIWKTLSCLFLALKRVVFFFFSEYSVDQIAPSRSLFNHRLEFEHNLFKNYALLLSLKKQTCNILFLALPKILFRCLSITCWCIVKINANSHRRAFYHYYCMLKSL